MKDIHDSRRDQVVFNREHKLFSKIIDVCDGCEYSRYDIVDGEYPCKSVSCPFYWIAVHWIQIRDAKIIGDDKYGT